MAVPVNISTTSVPEDFCFRNWPQAWAFLTSLLAAELAGTANLFNVGSTKPGPDEIDRPWIKTDSAGRIEGVYTHSDGAWVAKHPMPAGAIILYQGDPSLIDTYDGGEAGAITATTGPMWQKLSDMDGKIPIGPGTLPSGRVIAVNGTLGEEKFELLEEHLPRHDIEGYFIIDNANLGTPGLISDDDRAGSKNGTIVDSFGGDANGDTTPHENMPPVVGKYFLIKTTRTHYRII